MAKEHSIVRFDPEVHAEPAHQYAELHVIVGALPLGDITFRLVDDEIVPCVGERRSALCPRLSTLIATSHTPPIRGAETRQHLEVACDQLVQVAGRDAVTSYPACILRAGRLGLQPDNLSDDWLTDPGPVIRNAIRCPFQYLGGRVESEDGCVPVAIDAYDPNADPDKRYYAW